MDRTAEMCVLLVLMEKEMIHFLTSVHLRPHGDRGDVTAVTVTSRVSLARTRRRRQVNQNVSRNGDSRAAIYMHSAADSVLQVTSDCNQSATSPETAFQTRQLPFIWMSRFLETTASAFSQYVKPPAGRVMANIDDH
ncbi:unnamed protein product [Merluccius merluccius]